MGWIKLEEFREISKNPEFAGTRIWTGLEITLFDLLAQIIRTISGLISSLKLSFAWMLKLNIYFKLIMLLAWNARDAREITRMEHYWMAQWTRNNLKLICQRILVNNTVCICVHRCEPNLNWIIQPEVVL